MPATLHAHPACLNGPKSVHQFLEYLKSTLGCPVWIDACDPKNTIIPLRHHNIRSLGRDGTIR